MSILLLIGTGCASLSDRGNINKTTVSMPDGSMMTIVDRTKINLFVPSTTQRWEYRQADGENTYVRVKNADYTHQAGMGPAIITKSIEAGGMVGSAYYIGKGLADSGDDIDNSTRQGGQSQGQGQGQQQGQISKNYNANRNHNTNINPRSNKKKRGWGD